MATPRVSVVLPVLEPDPDHLRQAVASILGQTLIDLELFVVEDPSSVSAKQVLGEFNDPRLKHVENNQRTGFAEQLNQGLDLARADLIARMDGDDVAEPERLAKQVSLFEELGNVTVLGSQLRIIGPRGEPLGYRAYPVKHVAILRSLPRFCAMAHPTVLFDKRRVQRAGGYVASAYPGTEDYELWSRLASTGYQLDNHPEALLSYRIHPGGMKSAKLRQLLRGTIAVKDQYWRGRMDLRAKARYWGERMLMHAPSSLTLKLFLATQYQPSKPEAPAEG